MKLINCEIADIDTEIAYKAAKFRADYSFLRTPDALQLASAVERNCTTFITNDKKLKQVSEIDVVLVGE